MKKRLTDSFIYFAIKLTDRHHCLEFEWLNKRNAEEEHIADHMTLELISL